MLKIYSAAKTKKDRKRHYQSLVPTIRRVARESGYAIGLHGSMTRDLDLIAAPWTKKAVSSETLALRIEKAVCKYRFIRSYKQLRKVVATYKPKPHGRIAYVIMTGQRTYIDLSVLPRLSTPRRNK